VRNILEEGNIMKNERRGNVGVRWSRVAATMLVIVVVLVGTDGVRRSFMGRVPRNIIVKGSFRNTIGTSSSAGNAVVLSNSTSQGTTDVVGVENLGFSELSLTADDLNRGMLALYTNESPAKASTENMVNLCDSRNDFYSLVSDEAIYLDSEAAEALNRMMADYNAATGLSDFVAYGTTDTYTGEGSYCPEAFPDSRSGYTVDLALNGYDSVISYDGADTQGWIDENCWNYGFIVRYPKGKTDKTGHDFCPWHLRYVGKVHSELMKSKNYSLEEYVASLKEFTIDSPLTFESDGNKYDIYSCPVQGDSISVRVPISGNYTVSGDNSGAFIVTVKK